MAVFDGDFEGLYFKKDTTVGLKMIIAIHDSTLGDALGGIRFYPYADEEAAITDVKRLARGMTYKNAIIHRISRGRLSHGGGKAVIWGNPKTDKTPELFHAAAEAINLLNGKYIGGEDMNMTVKDVEIMYEKTQYVTGLQETHYRGGRIGSGDPSPVTALGVFEGIRSCLKFSFGTDWMAPRKFAIQGVGSVGMALLEYLAVRSDPSGITISDTDEAKISRAKLKYPGIQSIDPRDSDEIYDQKCDVFVPCAIGGTINDGTIERLAAAGVKIVAGCANNQLLEPRHGTELKNRGILYAPDYVINAGGAINVAIELKQFGYNHNEAIEMTKQIGPLLTRILEEAKQKDISPECVADEIAETELADEKERNNFTIY
ncbi:MAG: Glu/Leu/Phe/Val dehydrogenase dimerization domain-containing protein [Candidatus Spechtbacterales bacterium]